MEILTIYIGQGELGAVRHASECIIVDSRWPDDLSQDIEKKLDLFTKNQNVVGLVLTGFDNDHADPVGVEYILENYKPDWVMYPKYYKETDNATKVFNVINKHVARRKNSAKPLKKVSVRLDKLDSRKLNDLAIAFDLELYSPHIEDMDNSNNCSIVLKIDGIGGDGFSYLVTGDTENERWDTITRLFGSDLKSDVLSAPHHGSKNASHPRMVMLVDPNTVLISAGVDNQYGHPDSQAVAIYNKVAEHVFQTNIEGGVSLHTQRKGDDFETLLVK